MGSTDTGSVGTTPRNGCTAGVQVSACALSRQAPFKVIFNETVVFAQPARINAMPLLTIVLISAACLLTAYFTYGPVLSRLLNLRPDVPTPAKPDETAKPDADPFAAPSTAKPDTAKPDGPAPEKPEAPKPEMPKPEKPAPNLKPDVPAIGPEPAAGMGVGGVVKTAETEPEPKPAIMA